MLKCVLFFPFFPLFSGLFGLWSEFYHHWAYGYEKHKHDRLHHNSMWIRWPFIALSLSPIIFQVLAGYSACMIEILLFLIFQGLKTYSKSFKSHSMWIGSNDIVCSYIFPYFSWKMAAILNFDRILKKKVAQMLFVINTVPIAKTALKSVHKYSSYRWPNKQTHT